MKFRDDDGIVKGIDGGRLAVDSSLLLKRNRTELLTQSDFPKEDSSMPMWITNHPKSIKGLWPRRVGCEYVKMRPRASETYTVKELEADGIVGVGVNMTREEYYALPVARNPEEFAEIENRTK